ncbi:hypothetical protein Tco_1246196 [Tanacetum coccineum]
MREYEAGNEDSEIEFPAIVPNNTSTSDTTVSYEPTVEGYTEGIVHSYEQRLETIWSRPVNRVHVLYFVGLTLEMSYREGFEMVYTRGEGQQFLSTCWMSDIEMGLDVADTLCFQLGGIRRRMTWRQFILALGLHTKQENGQEAPEKAGNLGMPREEERGRLSRSHFIGRLAMNFGLDSDEGLRGLQVVTLELPLIDLHELGRLNICSRYGDTWAWVASVLERQQVAAAGAHKADEAVRGSDEGAQSVPHSSRHLLHLHPPLSPRLCLRGDVESFTTKQSRVSTWLTIYMTQLMDASGHTYQAFNRTLVGSSWMPYQRRVRPKTGDASTFVPLIPMTSLIPDLSPLLS